MPETRIVYTLKDVRDLLSRTHRVDVSQVKIFASHELCMDDYCGTYVVDDETFIFEIIK